MRVKHIRFAHKNTKSKHDKEHVTPYIIKNYDNYIFTEFSNYNLYNYRCTIDTFDDYLKAIRLLKGISDLIKVDTLEILKKLRDLEPYPIFKKKNRLILGAAQFGQFYGITNKKILNEENTKEIIKTSIINGIEYIDTARGYGKSEEFIGKSISKSMQSQIKVITKFPSVDRKKNFNTKNKISEYCDSIIYKSLNLLKRDYIDILLFHNSNDINYINQGFFKRIIYYKKIGIVKKIGASVQNCNQFENLLDKKNIDVIQFPFNILDWRWESFLSKHQNVIKKRKIELHARSIFLQGLLLSNNKKNWYKANCNKDEEVIVWLKKTVRQFKLSNICSLCLNYVYSFNLVNRVIIGVNSSKHLNDNLSILEKKKI